MLNKFLDAYEESTEKYRVFGMSWQMILSFCYSLTALLLAIFFPASPWKWFCFIGMIFSSLGDVFLTKYSVFHRFIKGDLLVFGGSAFAIAHGFYAYGFRQKAIAHGGVPDAWWIFFGVMFVLAAIGLSLCTSKNEKPNWPLTFGMIFYAACICLNGSMIFSAAVASGNFAGYLALFGFLCFYISDAILLCGVVGPKKIKHYDGWIWITYSLAQLLLITCA